MIANIMQSMMRAPLAGKRPDRLKSQTVSSKINFFTRDESDAATRTDYIHHYFMLFKGSCQIKMAAFLFCPISLILKHLGREKVPHAQYLQIFILQNPTHIYNSAHAPSLRSHPNLIYHSFCNPHSSCLSPTLDGL